MIKIMRIMFIDPEDNGKRFRVIEATDIFCRTDDDTDEFIGVEVNDPSFSEDLLFYIPEEEANEYLRLAFENGMVDLSEFDCEWVHVSDGFDDVGYEY